MIEYIAVAGVAQLVEQLIRNQQVTGSSPVTSSTGSAGPKNQGLSLLIFFLSHNRDVLMNACVARRLVGDKPLFYSERRKIYGPL